MIRKIVRTNGFEFSIDPETGSLWIDGNFDTVTIPSEDATELLLELRKQQLDYLQKKQDQEESSIMKLLKSLYK